MVKFYIDFTQIIFGFYTPVLQYDLYISIYYNLKETEKWTY